MNESLCPCHSQLLYNDCCQPYHQGKPVPHALALMRSRYSAYALDLVSYIVQTTHPDNPIILKSKEMWIKGIHQFAQSTQFEGLEILDFTEGDPVAFVTFHAILFSQEKPVSYIERSKFIKRKGRWLYRDGRSVTDKIAGVKDVW